jgi:tetratricopeptide (TPR) repeat protein
MSAGRTKVLLSGGALILFVLLFIAPKTAPKQSAEEKASELTGLNIPSDADVKVYLTMAEKNLEPKFKNELEKMLASKKYDSASVFWDRLKRPDLASWFKEEKAAGSKKAEDWIEAGNRYYYSVQFCKDKSEVPVLYQSAIRCFKRSLALKPNDTDAKIMLASCYVEGSGNPMDGITLLREVEKTDSNNVKLQLSFAFFSVKSNQLDKAITRFNKVLAIDSNYIEAYLHLADAYERQGNTLKTVEVLEKYSAKTNDITARLEINKYIQQLKENK